MMNNTQPLNRMAVHGRLLALLSIGLLAVGCASQDNQQHGPRMQQVSGSSKVFAQGRLARMLDSADPTVRQATDVTPMSLSVPIRFEDDQTREAEYRFVFYDDQGQVIQPQMDWQWKVLPARTRVFFRGEAPTEEAANWQLYLRLYQPDNSR